MFSGWGIRSMSSEDAGYNPLEYHNGTIWPHDTALIAEGMRRYGFRKEAGEVARALLEAAESFSNQLPEVFAGFQRDDTAVPIEYPDALKPQSWAAAAPLLALRTLLGLDIADGKLRSRPNLPEGLGKLRLGASADMLLKQAGQPWSRSGRSFRYCVTGGGQDRVVFNSKGRAVLVASSAIGVVNSRPPGAVRRGRWAFVGSRLRADQQAAGV